jgi:hypothetical protein
MKQILAEAKTGVLAFDRGKVSLPIEADRQFSTFFAPEYHPAITQGPRLPALIIRGASIHDSLRRAFGRESVDWHLKSADQPFDSLDDLLTFYGLPSRTQIGDSATLEIVAHSPGHIAEGSAIIGDNATIQCRLSKTATVSKVKIGYKIFRKDKVERLSTGGEHVKWKDETDWRVGSLVIPVAGAAMVQSFFSYAGVAMHQWWLTDPQKPLNPRLVIHGMFDPTSEILKRMLSQPEQDKPGNFEWAISSLCNLLGFSTLGYGRIPKLQQGPDVIALTSSGNICVIECTLGLIDQNDKLAKLIQRTASLREKFAGAGYNPQIQSVIVTPLTRAEVALGLEAAGKHQVAVFCREDLERLVERIGLPMNSDGLFQELERFIPGGGKQSLDNPPMGLEH